jgi:hypothetical protein
MFWTKNTPQAAGLYWIKFISPDGKPNTLINKVQAVDKVIKYNLPPNITDLYWSDNPIPVPMDAIEEYLPSFIKGITYSIINSELIIFHNKKDIILCYTLSNKNPIPKTEIVTLIQKYLNFDKIAENFEKIISTPEYIDAIASLNKDLHSFNK